MSFIRRLTNVARGSWLSASGNGSEQKAREDLLDQEMAATRHPLSEVQIERLRAQSREKALHGSTATSDPDLEVTIERKPIQFDEEGNVKKTL